MKEFHQPVYEVVSLFGSSEQMQAPNSRKFFQPLRVNFFNAFLITPVPFFAGFLLGLTIFSIQYFLNLNGEQEIIRSNEITQAELFNGYPNQAVSSRIDAGLGYVGN